MWHIWLSVVSIRIGIGPVSYCGGRFVIYWKPSGEQPVFLFMWWGLVAALNSWFMETSWCYLSLPPSVWINAMRLFLVGSLPPDPTCRKRHKSNFDYVNHLPLHPSPSQKISTTAIFLHILFLLFFFFHVHPYLII